MKKLFSFILVLILACTGLQAQQRITGGFPINIADAPWQVLLKIGDDYACGGSIVAPNFILTAKHCVSGKTASDIQVIAGVTCKNEVNSSHIFNVSRIILHPDSEIDVALLQLSSSITYNNNRKAINYRSAMNNPLYDIGNTARVSGWGWLTSNGYDPTDCLQAVDVSIISNQQATNMFNTPNMVVGNHDVATTGVGSTRQGACHGDSGGPLTTMTELNEPVLIGVVSWGRSRCIGNNANSPSVFVRVSNIVSWITSHVPDISGPSTVCYTDSSTFTLSNNPPSGTITWSVTGPFAVSGNEFTARVVRTSIDNTNGTLTAHVNGSATVTKTITPCISTVSGPSTVCPGGTATFTASNVPAGYTWGYSSNLTPIPGNPGSFKASSSPGSAWVSVRQGPVEMAKRTFSIYTTLSITGPSTIYPATPGVFYSNSPCAVSYKWELATVDPSTLVMGAPVVVGANYTIGIQTGSPQSATPKHYLLH